MSRKSFEPIYTFTHGDEEVFHGTLDQYRYTYPLNDAVALVTEQYLTDEAKNRNFKLVKRHRRGKKIVETVLHDPAKPEVVKFGRFKYGSKKGKKGNWFDYVDSDGRKYSFYLTPLRGECDFDKDSRINHKNEIERRIINRLVTAINGEEEPE
jgi:hypothetical protein